MGHEIRKHVADVDGEAMIGGPSTAVEVDESYAGGFRKGKRVRSAAGKTAIIGMLQRGGDVMTKVVPNVRRASLQPIVEANVAKGSEVHTDELGRRPVSAQPVADVGELDQGEEVGGELNVAGRHASEMLELLKERSTRLRSR